MTADFLKSPYEKSFPNKKQKLNLNGTKIYFGNLIKLFQIPETMDVEPILKNCSLKPPRHKIEDFSPSLPWREVLLLLESVKFHQN